MMHSQGKYLYESCPDYDILGLIYDTTYYTIFFILPKDEFGLTKVLKDLNGSMLIKHFKNQTKSFCEVGDSTLSFKSFIIMIIEGCPASVRNSILTLLHRLSEKYGNHRYF